jgi:uncharacterized membrane protein
MKNYEFLGVLSWIIFLAVLVFLIIYRNAEGRKRTKVIWIAIFWFIISLFCLTKGHLERYKLHDQKTILVK